MSQIDLQWFAAEDEGRTELPSEHRLREARKKGEIAKSAELNAAVVWLFAVLMLIILAPWMETQFEQILIYFFNNINSARVDDPRFYYIFLVTFLKMVLPFCGIGIVAGVVAAVISAGNDAASNTVFHGQGTFYFYHIALGLRSGQAPVNGVTVQLQRDFHSGGDGQAGIRGFCDHVIVQLHCSDCAHGR